MKKLFLVISILLLFLSSNVYSGPICGGPIGGSGQSPDNVVITGGTIDGTVIGGITPAAGSFTTLEVSDDPIDGNGVGDRDYNDDRYLNTYETIYIDAAAMIPCTTNSALQGTHEYSTNDIDIDYFAFDTGATEERVQFKVKFPENWDRGTIKVKFDWSSDTGSTTDDTVEWAIKAGVLSDSDTIETSLGTPQVISDVLLANDGADWQITSATPAITIGGTPALGDIIIFEVYRNTDGTDNMAEDSWLFSLTIQYKKTNPVVAW